MKKSIMGLLVVGVFCTLMSMTTFAQEEGEVKTRKVTLTGLVQSAETDGEVTYTLKVGAVTVALPVGDCADAVKALVGKQAVVVGKGVAKNDEDGNLATARLISITSIKACAPVHVEE